GSVLPAASVARTKIVCEPSFSCAVVCGEPQAANDPESTRHSKLDPDSEEENAKVGVASLVVPAGPESIVVSGAVVSTVNVRESGVESVLPAWSVARTKIVCEPSFSCAVVCGEPQAA